ncbi:unnamed protein product [Schistosoma turkestanicum]|nr:unnamed protein product [Schistosoma turkestanicum]
MVNFNFSTNTCRPDRYCGRYKQLVWENTTDVGCGISECSKSGFKFRLVCYYGPGGDVASGRPYRPV